MTFEEIDNNENKKEHYFSVWPGLNDGDIKPAILSMNINDDKHAEGNREPETKTLAINEETAKKIIESLKNKRNEINATTDEGVWNGKDKVEWSLTRNCSTFVHEVLHESGVIPNKPGLFSKPEDVFKQINTEVNAKETEQNVFRK